MGFCLGRRLVRGDKGRKVGDRKVEEGGACIKGEVVAGKKRGRESLLKFAAMPAGEESRPHPPRAKCSP